MLRALSNFFTQQKNCESGLFAQANIAHLKIVKSSNSEMVTTVTAMECGSSEECDGRRKCDGRGQCGGREKCDGSEEYGGGEDDVWWRVTAVGSGRNFHGAVVGIW